MNHKTVLNAFLFSVLINLLVLLLPSIFFIHKEFSHPLEDDNIPADLFAMPKGEIASPKTDNKSEQNDDQYSYGFQSNSKDLTTITYRSIIRELAFSRNDPAFKSRLDKLGIDIDQKNVSDLKQQLGKDQNLAVTRKNSSGHYSLIQVRYKNSSDNISTSVLRQLAMAMNRWTNIKTQVLQKSISLDDPDIVHLPTVYIASKKAFTFTNQERANLRRYIFSDGLVIFSNTADSDSDFNDVANSVGFELWNILGELAHNLDVIDKNDKIYNSFFNLGRSQLPDLLGIRYNGKIVFIYEDSGYAMAWSKGIDSDDKPFMKMGVNILLSRFF